MCGIAGIYAYRPEARPVDLQELVRVRDAMARRGPDGAGLWVSSDGRTALAHRRLAIIDLSECGAQPMASADGRLHITFNGEIYNYRELRRDLEANGCVFRSQSDTEVLLHLYARRGADMLQALRGMFAFVIWDAQRREIFAARDAFGIKPLYYADDGGSVRFASQVKALLAGGAVDTAAEPAGSVGFLVWGHVPEPYTLYRGIRALPAGCSMLVGQDGLRHPRRYFDLRDEFERAAQASPSDAIRSAASLREAVAETVRYHLVSDVPVGVFLSSGVDSTTIAGHAARESRVNALTVGFREHRGSEQNEVPLAAEFARSLGIAHLTAWITRDDFERELPKILAAMDQPTIDGVNTYFVSQAAARAGMKVALSGVGGDELFGGYPSYWQVPRAAALLRFAGAAPLLGRLVRRITAPLARAFTSPKYASLLEYGPTFGGAYLLRRALHLPWELDDLLDPATIETGLSELRIVETLESAAKGATCTRARIATLELQWYLRNQLLRDADWAGMAHSLEIRVPLVDVGLFREVAPLMLAEPGIGKADLARTFPSPVLDRLIARRKTGFATPVQEWTGGERRGRERGLRSWARRVLPPQPRMFRAMALVTDAYGGNGGIAKFNRDLLSAIAAMPECAELLVAPRIVSSEVGPLPPRVKFLTKAARGKLNFVKCVLACGLRSHVDLMIAGHINLAPLNTLLARLRRVPSILMIHGIDAWTPRDNPLVKPSLAAFTRIVGVSRLTLGRFCGWSGVPEGVLRLLPNCVDAAKFGPGPKPAALAQELGVAGRTVILTLGRLASEERYKGFDEVIEALPELRRRVPDICYLICGDGPDRHRLQAKAATLGVSDCVIFTGFVPEERKADYYRLADAYVMPSQGEGFGIVFLEALACGIPVLGSRIDGGFEALLGGELGELVDPSNADAVVETVMSTLRKGRGAVPARLEFFSQQRFNERVEIIIRELLAGGTQPC
jgi:asparagine synthase (glutamine-hydrolysing)